MSKDYICLHCKKFDNKTCRHGYGEDKVTCKNFWPHKAEGKSKEAIMKIKKAVNAIYENGGHM